RRSRQLLQLIYQIRQEMNKKVDLNGQFLIIDSFPVPVCQPIRNYRAKIFRGYANIGYKATKKIYFYGFKVHAIVSDDGYILDYVVTKASVHDARETVELLENTHPSNYYLLGDEGYLGKELSNYYLLGDEGYLGKELHQQLKQMGYELWTPYRKNMTGAKKHNDHQLMAIRRTIESDFSLLTYYNAENNRARSLIGFQSRLEIAILAYNLAYCLERFN
ncbi:IS982 family transposase, partial [Lactobacillus salivarius]|uniref:IS982 family transposase n=1 Tax=Ligilactobacillus salivarius TaxID=1624 RepID=UPI001368DBE4